MSTGRSTVNGQRSTKGAGYAHTGERADSDAEKEALRALQVIPNVGPAMARDLYRLGIRGPDDLIGRDPEDLYEELAVLDGAPHDPCVLDAFMAAVSFAETGEARPWWHFTPERKARRAARTDERLP